MKRSVGIFVILLLLVGCGKKKEAVRFTPTILEGRESIVDSVGEKEASSTPIQREGAPQERREGVTERQVEREYDNMRGFDPAWEDDMEDNGMRRFMENNDDEGWE